MLDIYVINLQHRTDRLEHIVNIFGKNFNLIRVDAIKHEYGLIGCFMSHQKCLQIAKEKNLNNIIVIEDDCTINPYYANNFADKINDIKTFLDNYEDWDIFVGGCTKMSEQNIVKKIDFNNIIEINKANTTHFMIYNSSCYDFFLDFKDFNTAIDAVWHYKLRGLTMAPFIAYQLVGYSDIEKKAINYSRVFRSSERKIFEYLAKNNL